MKQDEIRNEILSHCLNGTHADYAAEKIMNLLSKKPSVSDEEIKEIAKAKANKHSFIDPSDAKFYQEVFEEAFEYFKSLPPQVVQSEVSEKQIDSFISDIWVYLADDFDKADRFYFKKCVNDFINSLTPPDAEAVMFAEWIYKNYISNGIGKYYHNNWNGDLDTLVNYTTQELFTLYKQGGK